MIKRKLELELCIIHLYFKDIALIIDEWFQRIYFPSVLLYSFQNYYIICTFKDNKYNTCIIYNNSDPYMVFSSIKPSFQDNQKFRNKWCITSSPLKNSSCLLTPYIIDWTGIKQNIVSLFYNLETRFKDILFHDIKNEILMVKQLPYSQRKEKNLFMLYTISALNKEINYSLLDKRLEIK